MRVDRVLSGQTLEVSQQDSQALSERVRLIGIEAPSLEQAPWGNAARQRLERLINGKPVLLESDREPKDRYERRLAYLWSDGKLLNEQLVAEGLVLAVPRSPNIKYDQRLHRAQEKARILGLGIWNPDKPMRTSPSEFRQQ